MEKLQKNNNLRHASRKLSKMFFITVRHTKIDKNHVFLSLEEYCLKLLVSEEDHFLQGDIHHHIYMRTDEKFRLNDIRQLIYTVYDIIPLDDRSQNEDGLEVNDVYVATCRNEMNALKYVTKSDSSPIYKGINVNMFSFYHQSINWAKSTDKYKATDPHVLSHPQYYNLLKEVVDDTHSAKLEVNKPKLLSYTINLSRLVKWQIEVVDWWNEWINEPYQHKRKQLYLHGPSNVGKTTFIRNLLKNCMAFNEPVEDIDDLLEDYIFCPTPNEPKYAYEDYQPDVHQICLIDEFDIKEYRPCDLKKFLAGESLKCNRKNLKAVKVKHCKPVIMISNLSPPSESDNVNYTGIITRLRIVHANEQYIPNP